MYKRREITSFSDAMTALRPFYKNTRRNYDLALMRRLMEFLGNPQEGLRVVHVAGTSGKTSTAYYVTALLQAAGKKVGLTVSPHVDAVNERVQLDGQPLPETEFCSELAVFLDLVRQSKLQPTYFETMVAFAYWEFAKRQVDYAVVEVGLGGLLDGTNVVNRRDKVCIITDIGLDHTEVLGDTLEEIAVQKAGIIQTGNRAFLYRQGPEVMRSVQQRCKQVSAELQILPDEAAIRDQALPLFQQRNLGLAVQAANYVRQRDGMPACTDDEVASAAATRIPARMECFQLDGKVLVLDGSHNAQKLQALATSIEAMYPGRKPAVLAAFVDGPASRWQGGAEVFMHLAGQIVVTSFSAEQDVPKRSVPPAMVADYLRQHGFARVRVIETPSEGLKDLLQAEEPLLVVAGSFYLLNHIRPQLL